MTRILNRKSIAFGSLAVMLGMLIILMQSRSFMGLNLSDLAVSVDLLFTVPLIYFLLIRKTDVPNTTVIPVMIAGLLLGYSFLPERYQTYLELFKTWILPVVEISILTLVVIKVRKAIRVFKANRQERPDFFDALRTTCSSLLPRKVAIAFATEIAVIYYGLINWKKRELNPNEFTYHSASGTPALLYGFMLVVITETVVLHNIFAGWNTVLAWILTILSLYTALQIFGIARSLSKRPFRISVNHLTLRYGIAGETTIPLSDIRCAERSTKDLEKNQLTRKLSFLGDMEGHNVVVHTSGSQTLTGFYGFKKTFTTLAFHVDDPDRFLKMLAAGSIENSSFE